MPTVALQVTVTDYAKWRPIFDQHRSARAQAGFKNERVFRNVDDPNEVIIWGEATSGSKLRRALASPELKTAMKEAGGVDGTLKLHVIPFCRQSTIRSEHAPPKRPTIRLLRTLATTTRLRSGPRTAARSTTCCMPAAAWIRRGRSLPRRSTIGRAFG